MIEADVPKSWSSLHEAQAQVDVLRERREREEREKAREEDSSDRYPKDHANSQRDSDLNNTFMRAHKNREYRETFGKEFGTEDSPVYSKLSMASSFRRSDKSMHLVDR